MAARWRRVVSRAENEVRGRLQVWAAIRCDAEMAPRIELRWGTGSEAIRQEPAFVVQEGASEGHYVGALLGTIELRDDPSLVIEGWAGCERGDGSLFWDVVWMTPTGERTFSPGFLIPGSAIPGLAAGSGPSDTETTDEPPVPSAAHPFPIDAPPVPGATPPVPAGAPPLPKRGERPPRRPLGRLPIIAAVVAVVVVAAGVGIAVSLTGGSSKPTASGSSPVRPGAVSANVTPAATVTGPAAPPATIAFKSGKATVSFRRITCDRCFSVPVSGTENLRLSPPGTLQDGNLSLSFEGGGAELHLDGPLTLGKTTIDLADETAGTLRFSMGLANLNPATGNGVSGQVGTCTMVMAQGSNGSLSGSISCPHASDVNGGAPVGQFVYSWKATFTATP
jgi:hypothetical protein